MLAVYKDGPVKVVPAETIDRFSKFPAPKNYLKRKKMAWYQP
jgi:hypothetical protein